ncbi:MAG: PhzF family phenazine biosynthesis protein [Pseudomonadales bacterium]
MKHPIYHVNAFTGPAGTGNPAAICLLEQQQPDHWLQAVAAQMNLSETAFVLPMAHGYSLRWFTPDREVELCGHATLASAHVLRELGELKEGESVLFHTLSGELKARCEGALIALDFPVTEALACEAPSTLIEALGVTVLHSAKFGAKYLLELETQAALLAAKPDMNALRALPERGVCLTCRADSDEYDFISRYFAPWVGIDEDPVNGSSHCALAPYWAKKMNKVEFKARQASRRGGELRLALQDQRVAICGAATTVLSGHLTLR